MAPYYICVFGGMLKNAALTAISILILSVPIAGAQSAFNSTADTGEFGNTSEPTNTQYPQQAGPWGDAKEGTSNTTGTQGVVQQGPPGGPGGLPRGGFAVGRNLPNLQQTVTSMPTPGTKTAGGNLALKQQGLTELPETATGILSDGSGVAVPGAEKVVGDENAYMNSYNRSNAIDTLMSPQLSTGHKSNAPRVSEDY